MSGRRERLIRARRSAGLTQDDLAHRLRVDDSTVNRPQPDLVRRRLTSAAGEAAGFAAVAGGAAVANDQ